MSERELRYEDGVADFGRRTGDRLDEDAATLAERVLWRPLADDRVPGAGLWQ
jgi:hypothetical protein